MLGNIGENAVKEFFDDLVSTVGYEKINEVNQRISKDVDNKYLEEALQSSMNVITSGLLMHYLNKQEELIEKILKKSQLAILSYVAPSVDKYKERWKKRLRGKRGFIASMAMKFLQQEENQKAEIAKIAVNYTGNEITANATNKELSNNLANMTVKKEHIVNRERLSHNIAKAQFDSYNKKLLFKLLTKNFTPSDKSMIKKMVGKSSNQDIDIEDLNKIGDFMFVKDKSGNVIGLSEIFLNLFNSTTYMNK